MYSPQIHVHSSVCACRIKVVRVDMNASEYEYVDHGTMVQSKWPAGVYDSD